MSFPILLTDRRLTPLRGDRGRTYLRLAVPRGKSTDSVPWAGPVSGEQVLLGSPLRIAREVSPAEPPYLCYRLVRSVLRAPIVSGFQDPGYYGDQAGGASPSVPVSHPHQVRPGLLSKAAAGPPPRSALLPAPLGVLRLSARGSGPAHEAEVAQPLPATPGVSFVIRVSSGIPRRPSSLSPLHRPSGGSRGSPWPHESPSSTSSEIYVPYFTVQLVTGPPMISSPPLRS